MSKATLGPRQCRKCGSIFESYRCSVCAKAYAEKYYVANREKHKAACATWRLVNADKAKLYDAAWREANREKHRARSAAWYKDNPEKARASRAAYRRANPDKAKERAKAWTKANPEARKVIINNNRAKRRDATGKLSKGLTEKLFKLQKGRCACCGDTLGYDYHLDHIMPISLGGSNTDDNIQLLKAECNLKKHAKHPIVFMQSLGFLL